MSAKNKELKMISALLIVFFGVFLIAPLVMLFVRAFIDSSGSLSLSNFQELLGDTTITQAFLNSLQVAIVSGLISVVTAFCVAYGVNYTNIPKVLKNVISILIMVPMLLPTITYGFAIIYAFGNQGILPRLFNLPGIDFYGFSGLLLGYTVYTLPITFLMINNAMKYVDKKFATVSKLMGDNGFQTFKTTVLIPLMPTIVSALIQAFFMAFTDYGIPSYIGGSYNVIATELYNQMLGSLPNFNNGAVIGILMLLPSVISMYLLHRISKKNIRYETISYVQPEQNKGRDIIFGGFSVLTILLVIAVFMPIFIVPFTQAWPYNFEFTTSHLFRTLDDPSIMRAFRNSILVSTIVAGLGALAAYLSAVIVERSQLDGRLKGSVQFLSVITNTVPGMVIGLSYLLLFNTTSLKNTFAIIIIANMIHYFSTPYLTMKNTLSKMSSSWEPTAQLMGDSFSKTLVRIVTPNAKNALYEIFSYYFINSMVTISAVIFLVSTRTILITTKIQELQYYNNFNEVFILSILLFLTNVIVKIVFNYLASEKSIKIFQRRKKYA